MIISDAFKDYPELAARTVSLNAEAIDSSGQYVLVVLRRALRSKDNPAIDVAVAVSNSLSIPVAVYSQVSYDEPYACDRFHHFILGANKVLYKGLAAKGIQHYFSAVLDDACNTNAIEVMTRRAAIVIFDQQFTKYERVQVDRVASALTKAVVEVDASRLVPHSALKGSLHVTKVFRAAHSPLRKQWLSDRQELDSPYCSESQNLDVSANFIDLSAISDSQLREIISKSDIDHTISISEQHPPSQAALDKRLAELSDGIVQSYRANRNNPALTNSTSELSAYLHFGMVGPWEIMRRVEIADVSRSVLWKFYDELLTWREWSHWRLAKRPDFTTFGALPSSAINTLNKHQSDTREVILSEEALFDGQSPDETWNAAQIYWRRTGWLHNNLRMYWAKQFLRWTETPERAWEMACKFNDKQSLDGCDPATYISMRWAFGEAKPGYSERPIYGWIAGRSDRALLKRDGFIEWRSKVLADESEIITS